jgi:hypothetical protein
VLWTSVSLAASGPAREASTSQSASTRNFVRRPDGSPASLRRSGGASVVSVMPRTVRTSETYRPRGRSGSILLAVLAGLAVQWVLDAEHSPSAHDVAEGLRAIAAALDGGAGSDR